MTTVVWNDTNEWVSEVYSPLEGSTIYEIEYEEGCAVESIEGLYSSSAVQTVDNLPSSLKRIGHCTFGQCQNLVKVVIPEGVVSLGDYCFNGDTNLKEVVFPDSLKEFGMGCFKGCTALPDNFPLPQNLTTTGSGTFSECKFNIMTIPDGWTSIPANLLEGSGIKSVIIPETVKAIGESAFSNCRALESVDLKNIDVIGAKAFSYCESLKSVNLSGTISKIEYMAFADCTSLSNVSLQNVKTIGANAFENCTSLTSVSLPKTLEHLEEHAFYGTGIKQIYLDGAETLYADLSEYELEKVTISKNIKYLDGTIARTGLFSDAGFNEETGEGVNLMVEFEDGAQLKTFSSFFDYSYIHELTLPASITLLDHGTFTGAKLKNLYLKSSTPPELQGALRPQSYYNGEFRIYVPQGSEDAYRTAEVWSELYSDIIFPYAL